MEAVAQLVRASDCGSEGRGFETLQPPLKVKSAFRALFLITIEPYICIFAILYCLIIKIT